MAVNHDEYHLLTKGLTQNNPFTLNSIAGNQMAVNHDEYHLLTKGLTQNNPFTTIFNIT